LKRLASPQGAWIEPNPETYKGVMPIMDQATLERFAAVGGNTRLSLHKAKQLADSVEFARTRIGECRAQLRLSLEDWQSDYGVAESTEEQRAEAWGKFKYILEEDIAALRKSIAMNISTAAEIIGMLGILLALLPELQSDAPRAYRVIHEKTMENYEAIRAIFHQLAPPFEV
jgi:hypothetical protein